MDDSNFKENYKESLRKEKLKMYSEHDISFLLSDNNVDAERLFTQFESVLRAAIKVVKREYEVNLKHM